jgi:hypothetical protein
MFGARHQLEIGEYGTVISGITMSLWDTVSATALYLALEPFVRRIWPQVLISSSKVLDGRIREASVGQAILVGTFFGTFHPLLFKLYALIDNVFLASGQFQINMLTLAGGRELVAASLESHMSAFLTSLALLMVLWVCRVVARSERLAIILFLAYFVFMIFGVNQWSQFGLFLPAFLLGSGVLFLLIRFGLVGLLISYTVHSLLTSFPLTLDTSQWFFGHGMFACVVVLALVACGILIAKPTPPSPITVAGLR